MEHSHCKECSGMIEASFPYCQEHCPCLENSLVNTVRQIVTVPGALDPQGVCGHCGYPDANRSFYRYRILACANSECRSNDKEKFPGGNIFFQAILTGRRQEESLRLCSYCKKPLHLQQVLDDFKPRMEQFKKDAEGSPHIIGVP